LSYDFVSSVLSYPPRLSRSPPGNWNRFPYSGGLTFFFFAGPLISLRLSLAARQLLRRRFCLTQIYFTSVGKRPLVLASVFRSRCVLLVYPLRLVLCLLAEVFLQQFFFPRRTYRFAVPFRVDLFAGRAIPLRIFLSSHQGPSQVPFSAGPQGARRVMLSLAFFWPLSRFFSVFVVR